MVFWIYFILLIVYSVIPGIKNGYVRSDCKISYTINPAEYKAFTAYIFINKNGEVIDSLPTAERGILVLRRIEELSLQEIAERTNWSLASVKRKLAHAEQSLSAAMADHAEGS